MDYRLLKLILIDSYSPGRVVEFPVVGGSVLTGRNGRGKTTLLQLVPIFYGENPTRIVGTETNRLDFNGYYLPCLTSYIVYEYQRRDQICCVILHSNRQGGERRYRFLRSAYRPDLFLLPDGRNILQVPDLQRHFKLQGVIHSEAILSVAEYRSIIQGKGGSGKKKQHQRALVADYASVGSGHHLTHIEKIVSGMFLRRTDFQDLQRMVVSCISDSDSEIALTTERRKIASWPEHYGAYTRAMEESGRMTEVLDREARLTAVETELGRIHARVLRLLAHQEETNAANRREREQESNRARDEEQAHHRAGNGIRIGLEGAGREAKDLEDRVAALERQQADYIHRALPGKAAQLEREPALREGLGRLQLRREALLGEQEKISLKYERLLNDLDRIHTLAEKTAAEARTTLFQGFEPRLKALDAALRADLDAQREAHRTKRQGLDERLQATLERKGEATQLVRAPQPAPDLVEVRDAKREAVEALEEQRQAADDAMRNCQEVLTKAKEAQQTQEKGLQRLQEKLDELQRRRRERLLQQSPGEDTLLHFLRTSHPDWVFDIAKVVRDDLLVRSDLDPELIESLPTLYGVGLDLDSIDGHLAADEDGLRREIAEIEAQLAALDDRKGQAEHELSNCNQARRRADQALSLANVELQRIGTRLASAREEVKSAQRRVEQDIKAARNRALAQLKELEQAEAGLKNEIKEQERDHNQAIKARDEQYTRDRKSLEAERQSTIDAHDQSQAERRRQHETERAKIESERDQALGAAGVDTAALKQLEREIDTTHHQLARIDQSRNEVGQWQLWLKNAWPGRDEHAGAAQAAREREAATRTELNNEERRWKLRSGEFDAILKRLDRAHARLEREIARVRGRLDGFRPYPPDKQVLGEPFDVGWTLDAMTNQANANQTEATTLGREIGKLIERIKRAFSAQRETPPDQFYETHRAALGPDAPARAWIAVFKVWFDEDHDAYRRTLAVEASQIAGAIDAFHRAKPWPRIIAPGSGFRTRICPRPSSRPRCARCSTIGKFARASVPHSRA